MNINHCMTYLIVIGLLIPQFALCAASDVESEEEDRPEISKKTLRVSFKLPEDSEEVRRVGTSPNPSLIKRKQSGKIQVCKKRGESEDLLGGSDSEDERVPLPSLNKALPLKKDPLISHDLNEVSSGTRGVKTRRTRSNVMTRKRRVQSQQLLPVTVSPPVRDRSKTLLHRPALDFKNLSFEKDKE